MTVRTLLIAGAFALTFAPNARAETAEDIAAIERAFAAEASRIGRLAAFRKYAAPQAIVFTPAVVNAHKAWEHEVDTKDTSLKWWPIYTGIALSGDFGFSTGPYAFDGDKGFGYYFTVWKKQPDGRWKWLFDGGPQLLQKPSATPHDPLRTAEMGSEEATPSAALDDVAKAESELARAAGVDAKKAFARLMTEETLVMGSARAEPKLGLQGAAEELERRAPTYRFTPLHAEAARSGDLVWTYGDAAWTGKDGGPRTGHYVRMWRNKNGWKLVVDQILPSPPPQPKPAA